MIHEPTLGPYTDKPRVCQRCGTPLPDLATIEQECPGEAVHPESAAAQLMLMVGYVRGLMYRLPNDGQMLRLILATLTALLEPDRRETAEAWLKSITNREVADGAQPQARTADDA